MSANTFFYDTEFLELGPEDPIALISIGIVHPASGKTYYAVNSEMPVGSIKRQPWLMENVWPWLPTLKGHPSGGACRCIDARHLDKSDPVVKPRAQIASEIAMFIATLGSPKRDENELWAWYSSYDHVVLAQLFGRMIDLPECVPMFTRDLKDAHVRAGSPVIPEQDSGEHHALADALQCVEIAKYLGVLG